MRKFVQLGIRREELGIIVRFKLAHEVGDSSAHSAYVPMRIRDFWNE